MSGIFFKKVIGNHNPIKEFTNMGNEQASSSKVISTTIITDEEIGAKLKPTTFDLQVAHYSPPSFPLTPVVTANTIEICKASWKKILEPVERNGMSLSGMTVFFTEFYDTLERFDTAGKFETVLKKHTTGLNGIAAKGALLIRIINFALALDPSSEKTKFIVTSMGRTHNRLKIRPWQYSIFIQILVNTISSRLGNHATNTVMSSWVHLFAYLLHYMLPAAIKGLVVGSELDINVNDTKAKR